MFLYEPAYPKHLGFIVFLDPAVHLTWFVFVGATMVDALPAVSKVLEDVRGVGGVGGVGDVGARCRRCRSEVWEVAGELVPVYVSLPGNQGGRARVRGIELVG